MRPFVLLRPRQCRCDIAGSGEFQGFKSQPRNLGVVQVAGPKGYTPLPRRFKNTRRKEVALTMLWPYYIIPKIWSNGEFSREDFPSPRFRSFWYVQNPEALPQPIRPWKQPTPSLDLSARQKDEQRSNQKSQVRVFAISFWLQKKQSKEDFQVPQFRPKYQRGEYVDRLVGVIPLWMFESSRHLSHSSRNSFLVQWVWA